jgi:Mn2+/Fe2+ NRAMP family transporter
MLGLAMLIAVAAMFAMRTPWGSVGVAIVHPAAREATPPADYLFMAVSLLGAYMTPYQFEFYSSGALEQQWTGRDLLTNRMSSIVGTLFGGIVTLGLTVIAAVVLWPHHAQVQTLADAAAPTRHAFGTVGLVIFAVGVFAVSLGAGIESALSTGYTVCQFFGWEWGKRPHPRRAPLFWLIVFVEFAVAVAIGVSGIDPISLTTLTMAFAAFTLPFTFLPILIVANDRDYMGEQKNTRGANVVAVLMLVLLTLVTLATIPLLVLTGGGT